MTAMQSSFAVLPPAQAGGSRMLTVQGSVTQVVKNLERVT